MSSPALLGLFALVFLLCGFLSGQRDMAGLGVLFALFFGVGAFWTALAGVS